jgi:hypothetical protein
VVSRIIWLLINTEISVQRKINLFKTCPHITNNHTYNFPSNNGLRILIDNYFRRYNDFYPLLHRPSFENSVMNGLHLTDLSFAAVLLVVCALGSRYSDDPELSGQSSTTSKHYAGWQWFEQIEGKPSFIYGTLYSLLIFITSVGSWPILAKPRLHNVQVCAVCTFV